MDISSMLEVQVKEETENKGNATPATEQTPSEGTSTPAPPISQDEMNFYKLMFDNDVSSVRFRKLHCTACDAHIGSAPGQINNMHQHPVLRTLLCARCRDFYGDGTFEQGDDATDMFCRWCANGGNLYCCSYCSNTFCSKCIKRNFIPLVRKNIEEDEKWKCFVCNPSALYSARGVCWALLQHVQTVTRILIHDKTMSTEEVEEKMNLDESHCCGRKRSRKRRRQESNSEEEDEPLSNKLNWRYVPPPFKRQFIKKKYIRKKVKPSTQPANGIVKKEYVYKPPIPIRPRPPPGKESEKASSEKAVKPDSVISPSPNHSRVDPNLLKKQSALYHTLMNSPGAGTYIQTPVAAVNSSTRIIVPSQSKSQVTPYQSHQANSCPSQPASSFQQPPSSQPLQSTPNTMVSIPKPVDQHGRSVFLLPKPKESDVTLTPNIIDLDSDSDDEPRIVAQQNKLIANKGNNIDVNVSSNKVVPVALTWGINDDDGKWEEQPLREICSTIQKNTSISEMMLPHSQELDKLLSERKEKMCNLLNLNNGNTEVEVKQRIKQYRSNMRNTVFQLVNIYDRVVRQFAEWTRYRKIEMGEGDPFSINNKMSKTDVSLDMVCVNDSDNESEFEDQVIGPSGLIKDSNFIKDLFCRPSVVHRAVGDDSVHLSIDKAIQVYDTVSRDYEKCISYSVCMETNSSVKKTDDNTLDLPTASNKHFGKYEEQFIFYLQHAENNINNEITNETDSGEMSLQETVQTSSPLTSQVSQDLSLISTKRSNNSPEKDLSDNINSVTENDKNDTSIKSNEEIIVNSDTNTQNINIQLDNKLQQMESQKTHPDATDEKVVMSDNETKLKNKNANIINVELASTESEEDCTIIDD
ncbi:hypothetical protein PUN28_018303 [Cardiocondyla obscurior]